MDRCLLALFLGALVCSPCFPQSTWPSPPGMATVPAGPYSIGVDVEDVKAFATRIGWGKRLEKMVDHWRATPSHEVALDGYFIDRDGVTCRQYAAFLAAHPKLPDPRYRDPARKTWIKLWPDRKVPAGWEDLPVTGITYEEAVMYAHWIGRRLPTEHEWEAAARFTPKGKAKRWFPWGDALPQDPFRANGLFAFEVTERRRRYPPMLDVGSFAAGRSFLGLNDLSGNAAEMTSSPWIAYPRYQAPHSRRSPTIRDFDIGNVVVRGGHANDEEAFLATFWRLGFPRHRPASHVGFRTVVSTTRGQDQARQLAADVDVRMMLKDVPLLRSDRRARRLRAELEADDARLFTSLMTGGFEPASKLPAVARFVTLVSRRTTDLRGVSALRFAALRTPVALGVLRLDVDTAQVGVDSGTYLVCWQRRSGKRPAAILLRRRGRTDVRIGSHVSHLQELRLGTRLQADAKRDVLTCTLAWPSGLDGRKTFEIAFELKLRKGTAEMLE